MATKTTAKTTRTAASNKAAPTKAKAKPAAKTAAKSTTRTKTAAGAKAKPASATPARKGSETLYWLFKSEPDVWSWEMQKAKGEAGEQWDGVRNYQARNHMREMQIGDRGFFYHSQADKAVVGIVEVCALAHPDSTTDDDRWACVDIRAVAALPRPVTLEQIKAQAPLADMVLVRNSRLSVQPVTEAEFALVSALGGL